LKEQEAKKARTEAGDKKRLANWDLEDTLAFLQLLKRFNVNFYETLISLKNDQHRRTEDTEASLGKYWKNIKSPKSKFAKPFVYPTFKAPPQKKTGPRLKGAALEERNKKLFTACQDLIVSLREKEILLKSGDQVEENDIADAKKALENVRSNRLARWEEISKRDEAFQQGSMETMQELRVSLRENQETTKALLAVIQELVECKKAKLSQQ